MTATMQQLVDLPINHPNLRDDWDKRYSGTVMLLNNVPIYISRRQDWEQTYATEQNERNVPIDLRQAYPTLKPLLPKTGYYNVLGSPVFIYKSPRRQWKRSYCTQIYAANVNNNTLDNMGWDLYNAFVNPEYVTLDAVSSKLFANVALSLDFAFVPNKQTKVPSLMYRKYAIADIYFSDNTIKMKNNSLRQEVEDLINYSGAKRWTLV